MANAGLVYASAALLAVMHIGGCSPAPAADPTSAMPQRPATTEVPADQPASSSASSDPVATPASAGNANIRFEDASLSFAADFPDAPPNDPVIADLRREAEGYLVQLKTNARADFDRMKKAGHEPRPWDIRVRWSYTARAGDLVSLLGEASEYTGGAHPNHRFDAHIARTNGDRIEFHDMLVAQRSPSPAMTIAVCEALKTAKLAKIKSATILDEPIVCVGPNANAKIEEARIVLAPSNEANKFGGIYAYYEPYAVGAYAEGPFVLTIQQEIFAEDLRPEFRPLFGGDAPAPKN
jgi:hypothetical protein